MPSITTWTRLEPICRENDVRHGLEARVHDPLWLLGRQWQLNEFQAEDAGSPVMARIQTASHALTRFHPGALPDTRTAKGVRFDTATTPLETMVEHETIASHGKPNLRLAIDAGRHFERLLAANKAADESATFIKTHGLEMPPPETLAQLDEDTRRLYEVFSGRVINGARLFRHFNVDLPQSGGVGKAARAWLDWYRALFSEPADNRNEAWLDDRLEYRFAVSARTKDDEEIVLESPEYTEGRLDWYDFAIRERASLGATAGEAATEILDRTLIPAPISYAGMPAERWWEFEDARIHFGAVDIQPGDLVSSVLLQFAIIYGNDWFVIPLSARVGSLCEVKSFVVTDSFGVATEIAPFTQANPEWRLFSLTQNETPPRGIFFLPPVLTHATAGPVLEDVLLARDELANLAWAVERVVETPGGSVLDARSSTAPASSEPPLPAGDHLRYRLKAEPPDHWIPLVPTRDPESGGGLRLRRAQLDRPAQGLIVGAPSALAIANEEVPKTGVVVTRSGQWTRWIDGSSHLWVGRRKLPGNGEASSGMRFDYLVPRET